MRKILFPTDFSESANHAFHFALEVADHIQAEIISLHVYDLPDITAAHLPHTLESVYESLELEEFEDYKEKVPVLHEIAEKAGLSYIPLSHVMETGEVITRILKVAKREEVDMVIMGTRGSGWLREILLGSVAGEVLENACCPVIAVPLKAEFRGSIDRIAITTTFEENEKRALEKVIEFARFFDARIFCINVDVAHTDDITHRMETFKEDFKGVDHVSFVVLDGIDIRREVTQFVHANKIDLLAMLTHKRSFFQELFEYSLTKKMAYYVRTPILSIQAHTLVQS